MYKKKKKVRHLQRQPLFLLLVLLHIYKYKSLLICLLRDQRRGSGLRRDPPATAISLLNKIRFTWLLS